MVDPPAPTVLDRLKESRKLVFWFGLLAVPIGAMVYFGLHLRSIEPELEYATVESFGVRPTEEGGRPLMNVRMKDGQRRTVKVDPYTMRSCSKGEEVLLEKRGISLRVALQACETPEEKT